MKSSTYRDSTPHLGSRAVVALVVLIMLVGCGKSGGGGSGDGDEPAFETRAELGEALFSDVNLSQNRTQACATCHNPEHAFIDDRVDAGGDIPAVSLGDDGVSLGDRNAPTAAYAQFAPPFQANVVRDRIPAGAPDYVGAIGGQFHDGREDDLAGQAAGPPTNPIEMALPDREAAVDRLLENTDYEESFEEIFGDDIFADTDAAYEAMAEAIGEFEETEEFAAFDSRFDRFLRGEYPEFILTKAAAGEALFFSSVFANCSRCHQNETSLNKEREVFTSFEYHNIGVPVNTAVRAANGLGPGHIDDGLLANPAINDPAERGKFKVPTLRNVAVTGPYMHNGVFQNLRTVVEFYDQFHTDSEHTINPETGLAWAAPEVPATVNTAELEFGRKLDDEDIDNLVCFMRSLTDARYEHLIEENGLDCGF